MALLFKEQGSERYGCNMIDVLRRMNFENGILFSSSSKLLKSRAFVEFSVSVGVPT